jgi:predicted LPLAT superfamily acyltransferase
VSSSELASPRTTWRALPERGTKVGIQLLATVATLGRGPARFFIRFLALYYALVARPSRRAIRAYLARVGEPPSFAREYRQILRFAETGLDAIFFLRDKTKPFSISRTGNEHLNHLRDTKTGAVLLGAHLGSFYAMRAQGEDERFPVYPVVDFRNARKVNALLSAIDPEAAARVIQIHDKDLSFMLALKDAVADGGLVAILADRVGDDDKSVEVEFLGGKARFPTGPFLVASALRCPVYLTLGLYHPPNRYDLFCEPFAERIILERGRRDESLRRYVEQYAARLEVYCRKAPDNWFNFYDFWRTE